MARSGGGSRHHRTVVTLVASLTLLAATAHAAADSGAGAAVDSGAKLDAGAGGSGGGSGDATHTPLTDGGALPTVSLSLAMAPTSLIGDRSLDVSLSVDTSTALAGAKLEVSVPDSFVATPASQDVPVIAHHGLASRFTVTRKEGSDAAKSDAETLAAILWIQRDGERVQLASQTVTFSFMPEIGGTRYFLWGLLGLLLGNLIRILMRGEAAASAKAAADAATAQAKAQAAAKAAGSKAPAGGAGDIDVPTPPWLLNWIKDNWLGVDLIVSLTLGVMALILLRYVQDPPMIATSPPWCVSLGFGIGLLAQTDMASRLMNGKWKS